MESQHHNLLKGYQHKILQLNSELEATKTEKQLFLNQNQRVKKLLVDVNRELQAKSSEIRSRKLEQQSLRKQRDQLRATLTASQEHRKVLYDHLFTEPGLSNNITPLNLMENLSQLQRTFMSKNFTQIFKILNNRNEQISKLSNQYNQLMRNHLKSTNEYQTIITKLREQNFQLAKGQHISRQIIKETKNKIGGSREQFQIANRTLEERMEIMAEKIKNDELAIQKLEKQIQYQKVKVYSSIFSQPQRQVKVPQVQEYLSIIAQNKQLKKKVQQKTLTLQRLTEQFPNIVTNEQVINQFLTKQKKISQFQRQNKQKQVQIQELTKKLQFASSQNTRLSNQLNAKIKQLFGNTQYYQTFIKKFKQFFIMVNPYYENYQWDQLQLDEKQLQLLKKGKKPSQQTSLRIQVTNLQQMVNKLRQQVMLRSNQLASTKEMLDKYIKKTENMQALNDKLAVSISAYKQEGKDSKMNQDQTYIQFLLQSFKKLQEQRNALKIQIKEKEIKIIQLMAQNKFIMDAGLPNHLAQINQQFDSENKQVDVKFCRPTLVWLEFNKDLTQFTDKIRVLQQQIKGESVDHASLVRQLKSQYQSQILELNKKILQLAAKIRPIESPSEPHRPQEVDHQQPQINETGTMLDLEGDLLPQQSVDQPLNTINNESIQQMNKLLSGHEINLKNIISVFKDLKVKYDQLKERKQRNGKISQQYIENKQKQLAECLNQLKLVKIRLAESDKNLIILESKLNQKTEQLKQIKSCHKRQVESLNKIVSGLNAQIKQFNKYNWLQLVQESGQAKIPQILPYFPEESQYLLQKVLQKDRQLKQIQKANNKQSQQKQATASKTIENKDSKNYEQAKDKYIQQLFINQNKIIAVLDDAIEKIRDGKLRDRDGGKNENVNKGGLDAQEEMEVQES